MKRSLLVFVVFVVTSFSSYLHAQSYFEYCTGFADSCSSYQNDQFGCSFQRGCNWNYFSDSCSGFSTSCSQMGVHQCHLQDGCYTVVVPNPSAHFSNLTIFNHQVDQISPDQLASAPGTTPYLFHVNVDETSRSWLSWSAVNKDIRIEYTYNDTSSWNHYETVQAGDTSAVLCHSGVRLNVSNYCNKMPKLYSGKLFFRFKIGNAPNWIYIRPISFYYNS